MPDQNKNLKYEWISNIIVNGGENMIDLEENKRKLQDLNNRFISLENTIGKIESLETELKELESKTLEDGFWNDTKKSNKILQDIKEVKAKYIGLKNRKQTLASLQELNDFLLIESDEGLGIELVNNTFSLEKDLEKLEIKMLLSERYDKNNAIITLHPGARWNRIAGLGSNAI